MYFKCERQADGHFSGWTMVAGLPDEWPDGSMVNIYSPSGNRLYNVPGDPVRYYECMDGAICHNCGSLIDKSWELHAEMRVDREENLCKKCWGAINHGKLDLPQLVGDRPLYRLKNSPVYRD